jgi:hypothetical protein
VAVAVQRVLTRPHRHARVELQLVRRVVAPLLDEPQHEHAGAVGGGEPAQLQHPVPPAVLVEQPRGRVVRLPAHLDQRERPLVGEQGDGVLLTGRVPLTCHGLRQGAHDGTRLGVPALAVDDFRGDGFVCHRTILAAPRPARRSTRLA